MANFIKLSDSERASNKFILKYNCVNDIYTRPLDVENIGINNQGWESLLSEKSGGIYRKIEPDWRAFLTSEGYGLACWTIKHHGSQVKNICVKMTGWTTFRNGQLGAALVSGEKKDSIPLANQPFLAEKSAERVWGLNRECIKEELKLNNVGSSNETILKIYFSDYEQNEGLDHDLDDAQVFRTPLDNPNNENLIIQIDFEEEEDDVSDNTTITTTKEQLEFERIDNLYVFVETWYQTIITKNVVRLRELIMTMSRMSTLQRFRVVTIFKQKYELNIVEETRKNFYEFSELLEMLLVQTLEEIIVKEISDYNIELSKKSNNWQIIGKKINNKQEAFIVKRDVVVQASNVELNGFHCFLLKYDCSVDQYQRCFNLDGEQIVGGWQSMIQSAIGVARMKEGNTSYIGSNDTIGQICWRIEHPQAKVVRVDVCLKGMSTTDEIGDKDAKIGVNVFCGDQGSRRTPAAIPVNSQRIDVIEMERVGQADFTEVHVNFQRSHPGRRPSQLFYTVFGEIASEDDFVLKIEFEQPEINNEWIDEEKFLALTNKIKESLIKLEAFKKDEKNSTRSELITEIIITMGSLDVQTRQRLVHTLTEIYSIEFEQKFINILYQESASELVNYLLHPPLIEKNCENNTKVQIEKLQLQTELVSSPMLQKQSNVVDETETTICSSTEEKNVKLYSSFSEVKIIQSYQHQQQQQIISSQVSSIFDFNKAVETINKAIIHHNCSSTTSNGGLMKIFKKKDKSDTEQILQLLVSINYQMRQQLCQEYKLHYDNVELLQFLHKELEESYDKQLIISLLDTEANLDALSLHKAIDGLGTDESLLIEILTTRSNKQINSIKEAYKKLFNNSNLEDDVVGDTSGNFKNLLLKLCEANKDESVSVDMGKAENDAKSLISFQEAKFINLLTNQSLIQLRALSEQYNQLVGCQLTEAVSNEFIGDTKNLILTLVRFAQDPLKLFAEWLNEAINANRENDAIRLICIHPNDQYNLTGISINYQQIYGIPLTQALYDSKLHTKHSLASIVTRGGVV